jgi:ectoine hydroxylase-related dioxygenase (phytanoyl-CoA dioxygenase family)
MRVVRGTQGMELHEMKPSTETPNVLSSQMDPELVDEQQAVDIVLKAGSVSVHHPNIVHGSNPNTSGKRRCGLTIRYLPTTTRITRQPWDCAFLLRGDAVGAVNEYSPRRLMWRASIYRFAGANSGCKRAPLFLEINLKRRTIYFSIYALV